MPQLYPRNINAFAKWSIIGGGIFVVLFMVVMAVYARTANNMVGVPIEQPVGFQHSLHAGQLGVDCRYCHTSVEVAASANYPPTEVCMTCHSQIRVGAPALEGVYESWGTVDSDGDGAWDSFRAQGAPGAGDPIPWNRVHDLADFVYFNHSAHLNGGVGCNYCHGRVDQMSGIWKAESHSMGWCLECHREPEKFIRPRSEVLNLAYQPPANQLELGRELVEAYHINTEKLPQCSTCHR